ncbi:XdhC family protein [Micromonospora kangleipakensis]|uniref:XdhC family protein n=1 Tax=Micromonospora kangleipakensis TaxID=1077942 RepID=UPI002414D693|nr:XdhC family protein [Micromonospora kangleipakensis]
MGTVVATWRSAPRPVGAAMLVGPGGEAIGSVSGGCVESAVYELAKKVVADRRPTLQRYGISDDDAFGVGLTCGGILDVFVERVDRTTLPQLEEVTADIADGRAVAVCTLVEHPDASRVGAHLVVRPQSASRTTVVGSLGSPRFDAAVADDAPGLLASGRNGILTYGPDGERRGEGARVFVASHAPQPRMIVFGAIDFAAALARTGTFLDYRVTVCDARPLFATRSRFPDADEVVVDWPHRYLRAEVDADRRPYGPRRAHA